MPQPDDDRLIIVGCSGNAGSNSGHDVRAAAAGQDAVWGKPLPTQQSMQRQIGELLRARVETGRQQAAAGAEIL